MVEDCGLLMMRMDRALQKRAPESPEGTGITFSRMRLVGYLDGRGGGPGIEPRDHSDSLSSSSLYPTGMTFRNLGR